MSGDLAISLRAVVKRYGAITAVNGLDLNVPVGTCVGLLGPNGTSHQIQQTASEAHKAPVWAETGPDNPPATPATRGV